MTQSKQKPSRPSLTAEVHAGMHSIDESVWDELFAGPNPFSSYAFLRALEDSDSVSERTGWHPRHILLKRSDQIVAAMPLYEKWHSRGEFVFDWGWAEAYAQHGLEYYPKLLTAIPFVPSNGPRIGIRAGEDRGVLVSAMLSAVQQLCIDEDLSGWHLLFPHEPLQGVLEVPENAPGLLARQDIQFHWRNRGYIQFDDFLTELRASRRKNVKRERRKVAAQGVRMERLTGDAITGPDWEAFYRCYVDTFMKRGGHAGYMTREFFTQLLTALRNQLMLVVARQDGVVVASALFLFDDQALYGRYWGALQHIDCLHFEACFYQGIEFCIEQNLQLFDPGTQGEHKLMRGFEPVKTRSYHWIKHLQFRDAIARFLQQEKTATDRYGDEAGEFLPYRRDKSQPNSTS